MIRVVLAAALLLTGCGPQPWSPEMVIEFKSNLTRQGLTSSQADCAVREMQKRISEDEIKKATLLSEENRKAFEERMRLIGYDAGKACR